MSLISNPPVHELQVAWWNTALSPNGKSRASASDLDIAVRALEALTSAGVGLIGLCEVTKGDLEHFQSATSISGFLFSEPERKVSSWSKFDTCVAYDPSQFTLLKEFDVLGSYGDSQLRVGQQISMKPAAGGADIHIIISHWPSRRTLGAGDPLRVIYGQVLRVFVNTLLDTDPEAQILLMGDYNDEPFSDSVSVSLRASRDRDRAESRPDVLYNPFWRHMTAFAEDGHDPCSDKGTYYFKSGVITRWHTFDQIIFSSSLVTGTAGWCLDEGRTRAISLDWLDGLLHDRNSIFDHRPIVGLLKRAHHDEL